MVHNKDPKHEPKPPAPPGRKPEEEKGHGDYPRPGAPERPRNQGGGGRPALDPPDGNTTLSDI